MSVHKFFSCRVVSVAVVLCASTIQGMSQSSAADSAYIYDDDAEELDEVVIKTDSRRRMRGVSTNTELISARELTRAACCNLGESFTTNPSVDVSYADAATGARQIKLLGLSGQYVQMLTENIPNFRGGAAPYGLGYVAGPWMQSIQVSKGASSVKNGYESVTGQINIELKKPQADPSVGANLYVDHMGKAEANFDGNLHLGRHWRGGVLLHGENTFAGHDGNGDGFLDSPRLRQVAVMNRWAYMGTSYVFQIAGRYIDERRRGGQDSHHAAAHDDMPLYTTEMATRRFEGWMKHAYIFDRENEGNVALMASMIVHNANSTYGKRLYDDHQREAYAQLMFERKFTDLHALSAGVSFNHDRYGERYLLGTDGVGPDTRTVTEENVGGVYGQYTYNLDSRLIAMAGLRYDYNSRWGSLVTPRVHVRYNPTSVLSFNASAGLGRRTAHPLADFSYLLASSRRVEIAGTPQQEKAWNIGASASANGVRLWDRKFNFSADYYFTTFRHQLVADLDASAHAAILRYVPRGHSHAFQVEAGCDITDDLNVTAAYRYTDARAATGVDGALRQRPLASRSKGLVTVGWNPDMGRWQFDVTLSINGSGRMPDPYVTADGSLSWPERYKAYATLNAQVTRNWRHWSVYLGGENLTAYRQPDPVIAADAPWGPDFDATLIYGPLQGAMVYAGFRYHFTTAL